MSLLLNIEYLEEAIYSLLDDFVGWIANCPLHFELYLVCDIINILTTKWINVFIYY